MKLQASLASCLPAYNIAKGWPLFLLFGHQLQLFNHSTATSVFIE